MEKKGSCRADVSLCFFFIVCKHFKIIDAIESNSNVLSRLFRVYITFKAER